MKLQTHLDIDVVALDSDDEVTIMLDLQAPAAPDPDGPRPEHTAVVVLDRSGSMAGSRLDAAKRALIELVARLDDRDRFGLVAFDHEAVVAIPAGRVGDLGRARLRKDIAAILPGGSTDLSSGYLRGLQEARRVAAGTGATVVLLSDGHANNGVRDPEQLRSISAQAGGTSITTSTIGIGTGYDESLLAAIAEGGLGNHAFAEHSDAAAAAVAGELDGLLNKTVQAASLLIAPSGDVAGMRLLNEGLPAQRVEGGILVELGDFYGGEQRKLVVTLRVPTVPSLGLAQVAILTLSYVDVASLALNTVIVPVSVNVVPADLAAGRVANPVVERERLLLSTQSAKRQAEAAMGHGDIAGASRLLADARGALCSAGPDVQNSEIADEVAWLDSTEDLLTTRDAVYNAKRMRADSLRKHRGYKSRTQGGEITIDPDQDES